MRAVILLLSVIAAVSILWWQAPEMVPAPLRHGLINLEHKAVRLISPNAKPAAIPAAPAKAASASIEQSAAMQGPLWPDPLEKPVRKPLPLIPVAAAAVIALAGLFACIWLVRRRANAARHEMPEWLHAARRLAAATNDRSLRLKQCDLIERRLLADMKHRGAASLARAHQLDLYWRYVGRSNLMSKSFIKGPELDRWRTVSKQTLEAIAVPPSSRSLAAFQQSLNSLWALEQGDARELKRYYDTVSSQLAEYEQAWKRASAAASRLVIDQPALLDAMETLRQLNRSMAKQTATLVGDIEISVRAAS
ncbi:MAG: hypothetical protein WAW96_05955 [Alphaproteobacteria bacterium]